MTKELAYIPTIQLGTNVETGEPLLLYGDGLRRHRVLYGLTGVGKSKLISSMCAQLLNAGIPFACIDPHTDLADDILSILLKTGFFNDSRAYDRLWYVTFSDPHRAIPFNWLKQPYPHHQIAENFVEVVERAWTSLQHTAVNIENILLSSCIVLLENNRPLTDLLPLLSDAAFREELLSHVQDELTLDFFRNRFSSYSKNISEGTLRRAFLLQFSPPLRNALNAQENTLDFSRIIDSKTSVLFDLGGLDSQTQRFLGVLLTVGFETAMLARAKQTSGKRTSYHLVIDEWHQFLSSSPQSLSRMLDLTRKFGMSLTLASQNFTQTASLRASLQNCLHIALRLGHDDAKASSSWFVPTIPPEEGLSGWQEIFLSLLGTPAPKDREEWKKADWWEKRLQHLPQAHALVHLEGRTIEMQTLTIPPLEEEERHRLARVKEEYAKRLLVPINKHSPATVSKEEEKQPPPAPLVIDLAQGRKATHPPHPPVRPVRRVLLDEDE